MKIGFSFVDLALGGAQVHLVQLAAGLAGRGHQIEYFLYSRLDDTLHAAPTLISQMGKHADRCARPQNLLDCEVIQLDGYHSLRRKLPYLFHLDHCVETFHSAYSIRRSGPVFARHRVAVSRAVQKHLRPASRLIYNGILLPPRRAEGTHRFDLAILGRIHPVKGHLLFLQVCEAVFRRLGALRVVIIGGHPKKGTYQAQIDQEISRLRQAGIQVHTTGEVSQEQVYYWLQQVKVILVTSSYEGFGRMAVEAQACEVPVIANPVGGLPETLIDGETGYLASGEDVGSFTGLATRLLQDEGLRRRMGQAGRDHVERTFSLETMVDAYEALYHEVAGKRGGT